MDLWTLLGDVVVLLGASLLLGGLLARFGQSPLVGYLIAGMMLGGPGSFHVVGSKEEIEAISELGVALLLFSLGLEFSIERLKKLGVRLLLGGVVQVVLTVIIGAAAAFSFGCNATESIAFGAMISLSSTAVVLRMLMERAELEMPHGRNSLAVLLTQDIAVVSLAILMTLLAGRGAPVEVAWDVGKLLFMALALVVGMFLLNKIAVLVLGTLTLRRNRELTMIFAAVTGLGSACAAHSVGLSPALGAFVAGMLLGSSAFATQVRADVSPLRVVLLTLFFGAAGMVADPVWILTNWLLVATVTLALTLGKLAIIWSIFQLLGHSTRVASATGMCLAQNGEFAFVLGSIGVATGVVPTEMYALVVSVTIVSFFLSAVLVPMSPWFGNRMAKLFGDYPASTDDKPSPTGDLDVVIIGFGPAGQIAARPFIGHHCHVMVIDLNQDGVRRAQQLGFLGAVGDATQSDVLEHAHIAQAKAVVITVPHHHSAMMILKQVRQLASQAHVAVRSRYHLHTHDYVEAGAHAVVGDEEQVGESMANHLQQWVAMQEEKANHQNLPT